MMERLLEPDVSIYEPGFLLWLHREFYERLPESMRVAKTRSGERYEIVPGAYRDFMVDVSRHTPPHFEKLPAFMVRFCRFYGGGEIHETDRLVAIAAAHHRLAWIHPFGDGNGRVVRLYSQAMLFRHGLDQTRLGRGIDREPRA
mgnify:CR=1 FL=1